jgi:hypothetical protein
MQTLDRAQSVTQALNPANTSVGGLRRESFLLETCDSCKNSISLDVGDVIQGDKWYHKLCYQKIQGTDFPE